MKFSARVVGCVVTGLINAYRFILQQEVEDTPDFLIMEINDEDISMDAINDDNDPSNEDHHTGEHSLLQGFRSLQEAIDSEALRKPISTPADKTVGEIILMILKFVLVHALSLTATTDLFRLVNALFPEPFIPNTRYLIDKLFYPKNCTKLYATCSNCGAGMGRFERRDRYLRCKVCETVVDVKDYAYKDFFVMMDVATPISKLLESNGEYYNHVVNHRVQEAGFIRDIYDGRRYRKFVENLNDTDRHNYATVSFNTDGAPLFESSSYSIWPIFLMVNEVPMHVRSKELILVGLWFGKDKPNMNVFLKPFVEYMNDLSKKGVDCIIEGKNLCIKIFTLICCVDAVARAPVQGFSQFNGSYGCGQCLHPGEWVRNNSNNPRSGNIKYPLLDTVPKGRNVKETIKHMKQATELRKPVFGVKRPSELINLLHYDFIHGCVVDSLHCGSGIAKQFATMWFGNNQKAGILPRATIKNVDTLMNRIKAPHQVVRLTRAFSDKEFWKAREWENWTIYYSMVVLEGILPDNFLMHWALFVEAFYVLSKAELTIHEVELANKLLHKFVGQSEILYGKTSMTFNMHSLLHLSKSVSDWGPLWAHNAYAFESGNGELLKVIHAAKGVHHQICRRIASKFSYLTLKEHVYPGSSFAVKYFCESVGTTTAKQTFRPNRIRYFGSVSRVNELWSQRLKLQEHSVTYKKMVKNSCLYMSASQSNKRSNNSFAVLKNNSYVKIYHFIVDSASKKEYTIVSEVYTRNAYDDVCGMLKKIILTSNEQTAISTDDITRVCVYMTSNGKEYLCAVPNLYYY